MGDLEKKRLALRFFLLSRSDKRKILNALPSATKDKLLLVISEIEAKGLDKYIRSEVLQQVDLLVATKKTNGSEWSNVIEKLELLIESNQKVPLKLYNTIKSALG